MKMIFFKKCLLFIAVLTSLYTHGNTIFVPRQLAYNPIYEDALVFDEYAHMSERFLMSVKPIYTRTVGSKLKKYFNIDHSSFMNVREDGSGDIDSLWFQVISAPGTSYSSTLSFRPIQQTAGALFYTALILPADFAITLNTAFIQRKMDMHICERNIPADALGQLPGFSTITQAFMNSAMRYGRICGGKTKGGVDDIQIKLLKNFRACQETFFGDVYALVGIPTGHGSRARFLFEPLVGSNHTQFGLGLNAEKSFDFHSQDRFSLYGELKWRYAFKAKETRSFDITPNGQWSRYLLFTTPGASANPFFAINDLTFKTEVTPRNSFDLLLAGHTTLNRFSHSQFSFELGYNFWYRQAEHVRPCINLPEVGIADLVGIAQLANPTPVTVTTSSAATISEGVYPNGYQMPRDASYTLVTSANINACSGAQAASCSNAIFGSIGYHHNRGDVGINASYEGASNKNTASIASVWVNLDIRF